MQPRPCPARCLVCFVLATLTCSPALADTSNTFTVAAYNVENWVQMDRKGQTNQPKPASERAAVIEVVASVKPDVLGVVEIGSKKELVELSDGLRKRGLDYPHSEWVQGADETRHAALLSRFPIAERFSRTDYIYDLNGKPMHIQRGILDVSIQVNDGYSFRAIVVHLKSKRATEEGDQAAMRLEEAKLLRAHVGKVLKKDPRLNLMVMGDLNDTPGTETVRTVIGEVPFGLFDLMPKDSTGGVSTHRWRWKKVWSRIDYLLLSPGMSNEFVAGTARIADVTGWDKASDHRAVYASFAAKESGEPVTQTARSGPLGLILAINVIAITAIVIIVVTVKRRVAPQPGTHLSRKSAA